MTEPRWEATGGGRWVWSWTGAGGHRYAVVQHRGGRPWRDGAGDGRGDGRRDGRGWHRGAHAHSRGHSGPWLPLLLLFVFAGFSGAWMLAMLLLVVAFTALVAMGAYVVGSLLAGAIRSILPDGSGYTARPQPLPRQEAFPVLPPAPYRISGGALAARDGVDLYRKRLLEVLKERYVRGQISLTEFESRAARIAREPSARHLG